VLTGQQCLGRGENIRVGHRVACNAELSGFKPVDYSHQRMIFIL
jgi:hypothetical protein